MRENINMILKSDWKYYLICKDKIILLSVYYIVFIQFSNSLLQIR